jgi:hypothetical protein
MHVVSGPPYHISKRHGGRRLHMYERIRACPGSAAVLALPSRVLPSFLFLQEQIKDIIIIKVFKGNNMCQSCTANATTPLAGSVDASDCGCLPGFEGTFDTGGSECPVDFYKEAGDAVCRSCPLNSGTPGAASSAGTACVYKPGALAGG